MIKGVSVWIPIHKKQKRNLNDLAKRIHSELSGAGKIVVPVAAGQSKYVAYAGSPEDFADLLMAHSRFVFTEETVRSEIDPSCEADDAGAN